MAAGVLTASLDDALLAKSVTGSDVNGLSVMDWNEFRMSSAMESVLYSVCMRRNLQRTLKEAKFQWSE